MFEQPSLPYALDALAPYISEETMRYHFTKHHKGYFDKLNGLVAGSGDADLPLAELVVASEGAVFNNAAQAWNHILYWDSLSPQFNQEPIGDCLARINQDFGSVAGFKEQFTQAALGTFGSGWAWLVVNNQGKLEILSTSNAHNPLGLPGVTPVLACDVWEHAYYIDTRNDRAAYLEHFWSVCNWEMVAGKLAQL